MGNDISMCEGTDCPLKDTCYRYLAAPDYWQSYSPFYEHLEDGYCEYYWPCDDEAN